MLFTNIHKLSENSKNSIDFIPLSAYNKKLIKILKKEGMKKMFISLSKTLARFGGFRLGVGMRITKNNMIWMSLIVMMVQIFKAMWYLMIVSFWMVYAVIYGVIYIYCKIFKHSTSFLKNYAQKTSEETKKEG